MRRQTRVGLDEQKATMKVGDPVSVEAGTMVLCGAVVRVMARTGRLLGGKLAGDVPSVSPSAIRMAAESDT